MKSTKILVWFLGLSSYKPLACSRPSVSGSVRRAAGERGKNEEGLGREESRAPSLPLSHLESLDFSLAAVFVRFH